MQAAHIRIQNDLNDIHTNGDDKILAYIESQDDHALVVKAYVSGPKLTIYENDRFEVTMNVSEDYPVKKQYFYPSDCVHFDITFSFHHQRFLLCQR